MELVKEEAGVKLYLNNDMYVMYVEDTKTFEIDKEFEEIVFQSFDYTVNGLKQRNKNS